MNIAAIAALLAALASSPAHADLSAALAERNLERRARKALENAEKVLKAAQHSYQRGELEAVKAALEEVRESVELAFRSLKETGRDPLRRPGPFKDAEIRTRNLLKSMRHFREQMSYDDRPLIEPVLERVDQIHEELLFSVMGKKPRR